MRGGDISNELPRRIIATTDTFLVRSTSVKKVMKLVPVFTEEVEYNRNMLNKFWWFAAKQEVVLELAGIGLTKKELDQVMDDLNNLGTNPFNYANSYETVADLVRNLPYRPEVSAVVDLPTRALRYGSWYLDMGQI